MPNFGSGPEKVRSVMSSVYFFCFWLGSGRAWVLAGVGYLLLEDIRCGFFLLPPAGPALCCFLFIE